MAFRPDIQGLRAVAIALVVLAHAAVPGFAGGFVGVDVFFVLSGYLITGLLAKEHLARGHIRFAAFIGRRLRRLLPALLVMLTAVLILGFALLTAYELRTQSGSFPYAVTWTSNLFFATADFDYFSALQERDLFLHTWSLGVEEQFYIVWPMLISIAIGLRAWKGRSGVLRTRLAMILAALFTGSLALSLYWSQTQPLLSFYMMPSRIWQFALGALIFVCLHDLSRSRTAASRPALTRPARTVFGLAGMSLIIASAVLLHPDLMYPGFYAIFPSLGAALVIAAGANGNTAGISGLLAHQSFVWLGDRSYSLYLWHWPVLMLGAGSKLADGMAGPAPLIVLSIALAMMTYRWIERPFWKGRFSIAAPPRTILLSILAMIAVLGGSRGLPQHDDGPDISAELQIAIDARADEPPIFDGCDTWHLSAEVVPCAIGDANAASTAVLIGDSVGTQWISLLPEIFQSPDWQVIIFTKSACAIVDEDYFYSRIGAVYDVCTSWRNSVLENLAALQPEIVFVGSASTYEFSESQWVEGSARVLSRLTATAQRVVVIPGTPTLSFDGPSCISNGRRASCEEPLTNTRFDEVARYLQRATQRYENAALFDLSGLVCPGRRCAARRADGLVVFRDHQHLTDTFVVSQLANVRERLESIGIGPTAL